MFKNVVEQIHVFQKRKKEERKKISGCWEGKGDTRTLLVVMEIVTTMVVSQLIRLHIVVAVVCCM